MFEDPCSASHLTSSERRILLLCGWCGPLTVAVAFVGWLIAGVLPLPLGPGHSTEQVVAFYSAGAKVPMGIAIASVGVCLVIPLVAGIGFAMRRSALPMLIQLVSGSVTAVCLLFPMLIMAVAGFRPERDPAITVMLNDLSWLLFITPIAPFIIQNVVIAAAALSDAHSPFPRWVGFVNLWVGFTFTFDILAFAFKTGPFAWNGFLIFWLALTTYALWLFVMGMSLRHLALSAGNREAVP